MSLMELKVAFHLRYVDHAQVSPLKKKKSFLTCLLKEVGPRNFRLRKASSVSINIVHVSSF